MNFPLMRNNIPREDLDKVIKFLKGKDPILTQNKNVELFEKKWSNWLGVKYSVFVNSGSSANLLAAFALVNPRKKNFLKRDNEFLIPVLCWSTSLWPLVQAGLKPRFVDVDINNFNMDIKEFKKK